MLHQFRNNYAISFSGERETAVGGEVLFTLHVVKSDFDYYIRHLWVKVCSNAKQRTLLFPSWTRTIVTPIFR